MIWIWGLPGDGGGGNLCGFYLIPKRIWLLLVQYFTILISAIFPIKRTNQNKPDSTLIQVTLLQTSVCFSNSSQMLKIFMMIHISIISHKHPKKILTIISNILNDYIFVIYIHPGHLSANLCMHICIFVVYYQPDFFVDFVFTKTKHVK